MERFDDVSVVASVDESPPPPRAPRRARRAFTAVVATVVATGALAGAAVGLADEKREPSRSATPASDAWKSFDSDGKCRRGEHSKQSSDLRY